MNTRAAFDAMNGMFGGADDTTTMHGFGGAATSGRAGAAAAARRRSIAAGDLGGVTVNTRAAFDAMNGMFGGLDDTTTMHGFGRQASAAPVGSRRSLAAGDLGGVTMNTRAAFDAMNGMFGGDDTTTMHGFGRQPSAAAPGAGPAGMEPTITVNTRAAFDYMNGVFGAAGDATMNQTAAVGGRRVSSCSALFWLCTALLFSGFVPSMPFGPNSHLSLGLQQSRLPGSWGFASSHPPLWVTQLFPV